MRSCSISGRWMNKSRVLALLVLELETPNAHARPSSARSTMVIKYILSVHARFNKYKYYTAHEQETCGLGMRKPPSR